MIHLVLELMIGSDHPRPPSQQVSQIVWQREHWSFARISINSPSQAGQAGRQVRCSCSSSFCIGSLRFHEFRFIHVIGNSNTVAVDIHTRHGTCAAATHLEFGQIATIIRTIVSRTIRRANVASSRFRIPSEIGVQAKIATRLTANGKAARQDNFQRNACTNTKPNVSKVISHGSLSELLQPHLQRRAPLARIGPFHDHGQRPFRTDEHDVFGQREYQRCNAA